MNKYVGGFAGELKQMWRPSHQQSFLQPVLNRDTKKNKLTFFKLKLLKKKN
jgi:hypothetical protein